MNSNRRRSKTYEGETPLTKMELSCLALVANGYRSHEIGSALEASPTEIDDVLSDVERKLGAKNRLHAIGIAVSQGLIGIDTTQSLIGIDSK